MRFVDWMAGALDAAGTRFAFGVPGGGSSLDLLAALQARGIRLVLSAREDAATIMAGVSGLLAGAPGVAFTTKGPGLASATNGLASAALDRLPVLLVSESFDAAELAYLSHQVFDQAALTAPLLSMPGGRLLEPGQPAVTAWLQQTPWPPRGPAVMLAGAAEHGAAVAAGASPLAGGASTAVQDTDIEAARAALAASRRPVLVAGLEAGRLADAAPLHDLAERLGAPLLTTYMARGVLPDEHPLWAGVFTGGAIEQACVSQADLIVCIGLDPVELIRKPWPYRAPVLDVCETLHERHYYTPAVRLQGALPACLAALGAVEPTGWQRDEIAAHRQAFLDGMQVVDAGGLDSTTVVRAAADAFQAAPRLAVDAGAHMFSACAYWPCRAPLDLLISNGLATMGFAVPAALAAALHDPGRGAVAMTGDGGFMMCLGELKTAAETGAELCVLVFNDARLSLIDIKREDRQMPDLGMHWTPPDFAAVARGFGLQAWRVERRAELGPALAAAAAARGPRLVDVRIDSSGYRDQLRALRG